MCFQEGKKIKPCRDWPDVTQVTKQVQRQPEQLKKNIVWLKKIQNNIFF